MMLTELIAALVTERLEHGDIRVEVRNLAGDLDDAGNVWVVTPQNRAGGKYLAIETGPEPEGNEW